MRTEPAPEDLEADGIQQVDYRGAPHEVLEAIDGQLTPYGLEVVMLDTGDDSYAWKIARARGEPAP
jgi:hypothetical protein